MELENNADQPWTESGVNDNQPEGKTYFVNGRDMTAEEVVADHKQLQKTLTEKFQAKAEDDKKIKKVDDAEKTLEDAEKDKTVRAQQESFNEFKTEFSTLSNSQFKIVSDLQANSDKTFEEIAKDYWMIDEAQLERSRANRWISWETFALPNKPQVKVEISDALRRKVNYKTPEQRSEIMREMNL